MVVDVQQLAEYRYRAVREVLGGSPVATVPSRLRPEDIAYLTMRYGARPAGPEPTSPALPRARGGTAILAAGEPIEVERKVLRDGIVCLAGGRYRSALPWLDARSPSGSTGTSCMPSPTTP
uniref:hypothetical protein n=1 Tax=Streptomyces sp. WZ-12 TaxID=3030210 RepID=UPI0023814811|nr:hypothetical protein [Streptomyces sp. WZ-12]